MSSSKLSSRASSRSARTRGARPALFTSAWTTPHVDAHGVDEPRAIRRAGDVRGEVVDVAPAARSSSSARRDLAVGTHAAQREVPAVARERAGDAEADAARAAGDEAPFGVICRSRHEEREIRAAPSSEALQVERRSRAW